MLNLMLFFAALLLFACNGGFMKQDVPEELTAKIMSTFPNAQDLDWEKVGENFEAEFEVNKVDYTALLSPSGEIIMYKYDVPETGFPEAIRTNISQNYNGMKADDYEMLVIDGAEYYQVELDNLGKVFSADGREQTQVTYWE